MKYTILILILNLSRASVKLADAKMKFGQPVINVRACCVMTIFLRKSHHELTTVRRSKKRKPDATKKSIPPVIWQEVIQESKTIVQISKQYVK